MIYFDIFQPPWNSVYCLLDELDVLGVEIHVQINLERINGELLGQPRFGPVETVLGCRCNSPMSSAISMTDCYRGSS